MYSQNHECYNPNMNRRYVILIISEAIIIMLLLVGIAVMFVLLNRPASTPSLPTVPTFDPVFSTTTPHPFVFPTTDSVTLPASTPVPSTDQNATPTNTTASSNNIVLIPSATATFFFAPTWTFTPIPPTTAPIGQPCRNILYPVAAGQQWNYQVNALSRTDAVGMSVLSVGNSVGNVMINNQSSGSSKQVQVQCDGDVIRSFPLISVNAFFLGDLVNSNVTASYLSGVLAPNEAAFLNSNWALGWSSQYLISGTTSISRNGRQVDITMNNSPITLNCQTLATGDAAFETVTVPAGTFRALKVVCTEQGQVTATIDGITVTGLAEGRSNQWFALNTGLVKMQVQSATMQFFGVPFSILTDNSLELTSFTTAP